MKDSLQLHKISTSLIIYGCIIAIHNKQDAFKCLKFAEGVLKSKIHSLTPIEDVLFELKKQILFEYPCLKEMEG